MQLTPREIPAVAQLVDELCGVVLDETKDYLINRRLGSIAEATGCSSFTDLCQKARHDQALKSRIIDAITTQETLFFRDTTPYEALRHRILPEMIDAKAGTPLSKRLRIWSAAASTGQEAYSIAMTLCEMLPDARSWDIDILGTDISGAAIQQAALGTYARYEVQRGLKPQMLSKYFTEETGGWRVKDSLRWLVRFERRNLLEPFADLGPFDVVFCRNVAIYFQLDARRDLFLRLADRLTHDGYLFAGSSESLRDLGPQFAPQHHHRTVFYQPNRLPSLAMV